MAMNFYQSGQPESLSPAYQMLLEATMAKANATGQLLNPLIDALKSNREYGLQRESIDARRAESESDAAWKQRYGDLQTRGMDINERELGLKESKIDEEIRRQAAGDARFAQIAQQMGFIPGGQPAPTGGGMGGGTPFQDRSAAMGGVSPQSLLGGGQPQQAPQGGGGFGFDPTGLETSQINTLLSMQGRMDSQRKEQQSQQDLQSRTREFGSLIDTGVKEGLWSKGEAMVFKARANNPQDHDALGAELTKRTHDFIDREQNASQFETQYKQVTKEVGADPSISPDAKADFLKSARAIQLGTMDGSKKSEELTKLAGDLYGVGKTKPSPKGIDIPGIGMNITLNTSLKNPGTYKVGSDGKPDFASLPQDARSELTILAKQSLRGSPIFDSMLAEWMQTGMGGTEEQKKLVNDRMMNLVQDQMGLVLDTLGWKPGNTKEDARPIKLPNPDSYSMDEGGKVSSAEPVVEQTQDTAGPAVAALGLQPDAIKSAYDLRGQGREAVIAHLKKAMEPQPEKDFDPRIMEGVHGKAWLVNNPEPKASWEYNSGYKNALGGMSVKDAHDLWEKARDEFIKSGFDTSKNKSLPWASKINTVNRDGTPRK